MVVHTGFSSVENRRHFIRQLPKAEVHVHAEGTMSADLIRNLATLEGEPFPAALFHRDGRIAWTDFNDFLRAYDAASAFVRSKESLQAVIFDYLKRSAEEGVIYTELTLSPQHMARFAISYEESVAATIQGIEQAKQQGYDIEARIIIVLVRHQGLIDKDFAKTAEDAQNAANQLVDTVLAHRTNNAQAQKYVVGVGLAGAEAPFPVKLFAEAFKKVKQSELGITIHAGEHCSHTEVLDAIALGATRIGHGIFSAFDLFTMETLKKKNVSLEICISSNLNLVDKSTFPVEFQSLIHPVSLLEANGVQYSLNTDDPPFFVTRDKQLVSMCTEFEALCDIVPSVNPARLVEVTRHTIVTSFAEPELKKRLLEKLKLFAQKQGIE